MGEGVRERKGVIDFIRVLDACFYLHRWSLEPRVQIFPENCSTVIVRSSRPELLPSCTGLSLRYEFIGAHFFAEYIDIAQKKRVS